VAFTLVAFESLIYCTFLIRATFSRRCGAPLKFDKLSRMVLFLTRISCAAKLAAIAFFWLCFPPTAISSVAIIVCSWLLIIVVIVLSLIYAPLVNIFFVEKGSKFALV